MEMVEVQACELRGPALDWALATVQGLPIRYDPMNFGSTANGGYWIWDQAPGGLMAKIGDKYSPSKNCDQFGALMGTFWSVAQNVQGAGLYQTWNDFMVAACQAVVASVAGPAIQVPKSLLR
ncbi:hypothetical protein [Pseudomonas guariconensis]|uniref:hypothetical protein n=1 Tax=Pseudomonas guariconensis TaxID=1288410 RepID=UPI0039057A9C